jgi:hypothetical protein
MASAGNETFAAATILKAKSSNSYEADFRDSWCIGTGTEAMTNNQEPR